jgi:hypothetical protein
MPSTHSPLRCVDRLVSGDIIRPRRAEAFPRPSVRRPAVTASIRCRRAEAFPRPSVRQPAVTASIRSSRAEAFQDDPLAMQGDSLWKANRSCAESGMVTKSTPANKSACDCTIANPSHDERSPHSTHSRCGDGDAPPAQERRASARRGSLNRALYRGNHAMFGDHATQDQERRASARRGC